MIWAVTNKVAANGLEPARRKVLQATLYSCIPVFLYSSKPPGPGRGTLQTNATDVATLSIALPPNLFVSLPATSLSPRRI